MKKQLSNPCRLLAALAEAYPDSVTIDTLANTSDLGLNRRQISDAATVLARMKFAQRQGIGEYQSTAAGVRALQKSVTITSGPRGKGGVPKKRKNTLRSRVWSYLRMAKKATLPEMLRIASAGTEKDPEHNIRRYLRKLQQAEYVGVVYRREPGIAETSNGFKKWLLLKDTGPMAPIERTDGTLYDPNLKQTAPLQEVA